MPRIRYFLDYKKRVNDGSKAPYSHMSAKKADASQGTFFEVYGNIASYSIGNISVYYKKIKSKPLVELVAVSYTHLQI